MKTDEFTGWSIPVSLPGILERNPNKFRNLRWACVAKPRFERRSDDANPREDVAVIVVQQKISRGAERRSKQYLLQNGLIL